MSELDQEKLADIIEMFDDAEYCREFSRSVDEYFADCDEHVYLRNVWDRTKRHPQWLHRDTFPDICLVDQLHRSNQSIVCRGISSNGSVVCVKFPLLTEQNLPFWSSLELSAAMELMVLQSLRDCDSRSGRFPKLIRSGFFLDHNKKQTPFIVTEYFPGLVPIARARLNSLHDALRLADQICALLSELHLRRFVHGDLQNNIFLDPMLQPVILDFGCSQVRRRFQFLRGGQQRAFGPRVNFLIDEAKSPSQPLDYAFDVYLLARLFNIHFKPLFDSSRNSSTDEDFVDQRFKAVISCCLREIPEFRPHNAMQLRMALATIPHGTTYEREPTLSDSSLYVARRYPLSLVLSAVGLLFLLILSFGSITYGVRIATDAEKLRQAFNDGNRSRLKLLRRSVELERKNPTVQFSQDRDELFAELQNIMMSDDLAPSTVESTSEVGLQLALAHVEIDGYEVARHVCRACLSYLDQAEASGQLTLPLQLRRIEFLALYAKSLSQIARDQATKTLAMNVAESSAKLLLGLLENAEKPWSDDLLEEILKTGNLVAWEALYFQRTEPWLKEQNGRLAWQVLQSAMAVADDRSLTKVGKFYLAQLHIAKGRSLYKGFFSGLKLADGTPIATTAENEILIAVAQLEELDAIEYEPQAKLKIQGELARATIALSQVYSAQKRYELAQDTGRRAYQIHLSQIEWQPGSLIAVRDFITTSWIWADSFYSQAMQGQSVLGSQDLLNESVEIRRKLIDVCKKQFEREDNRESRTDLLVNLLRLSLTYVALQNRDLAYQTLHDLESQFGFVQTPREHSDGGELLICLTFLVNERPEISRFREAFENQIEYSVSYFREAHQTNPSDHSVRNQSRNFLHLIDLANSQGEIPNSRLQELKELLMDRANFAEKIPLVP